MKSPDTSFRYRVSQMFAHADLIRSRVPAVSKWYIRRFRQSQLEAARRLGVEPRYCRGYEDTDLGLEGIRAAGMEAVDVRQIIPPSCLISSL